VKVDKYKLRAVFHGEDGEELTVRYTNRGEPFSQGIELEFADYDKYINVYLEEREAKRLAKLVNTLYG